VSWARVKEAVLIFLIAACLYVPFLSHHFDENGLIEVLELDVGNLFSANHLLYRPLGLLAGSALHALGLDVRSLLILQVISALCGGAAIGFAYLFLIGMTNDRFAAIAAVFFLATTWAHWVWSTDAGYIPVAAMFVAAALTAMLGETRLSAIVAGSLLGFAVTTWQANVLLVPAFLIGWFVLREKGRSEKLRLGAHFLWACSLPIGILYAAGAVANNIRTPGRFLLWVTSHAEGAQLPIWGQFAVERIPIAGRTALNSVTPFWTSASAWQTAGVLAVGLLLGGAFIATRTSRPFQWLHWSTAAWLGGLYLVMLAFIIWWDPWATTWFVVPNIFLAGLSAILLTRLHPSRLAKFALVALLVVSAFANFRTTIWARHATPNANFEMAACVASHMQPQDAVLVTEWGWSGYLGYFFSRKQLSVIDWAAVLHNTDATLRVLAEQVLEVQRGGGHAYIVDVTAYPRGKVEFLESQLQLRPRDLADYMGPAAFECGGETFRRIVEWSDGNYIPSDRFRLTLSKSDIEAGQNYTLTIQGASANSVLLRYRIDDGTVEQFSVQLDEQGRVAFNVGDKTRRGLYRYIGFQLSGHIPWFAADATLRVR